VAKPIIKSLSANSFLDGSVVYENDARIGGELDGNVEIADLSEPRSRYNITVGPLYYGPDSTVVTAGTSSWESPDVSALVFQAPRDMTVIRIDANLHTVYGSSVDADSPVYIAIYKATALDGMSGAYSTTSSTWVLSSAVLTVDGTESSGVYRTALIALNISAGEFVRVFLTTDTGDKPQCELTVTLQMVEDHAE